MPSSPAHERRELVRCTEPRMAFAGASRALNAALRRPCHLGGGLLEARWWLKRLCWSSSVCGSGSHSLVVPIAPVRVVEVNPRRLPVTATRFRSLMPFLRLSPHSPRRCPPNVRLGNFASARPLQAASVHSSARLLERGDKPGGSNGEGGKGGKGDGPKTVPARSLSMSQKDKPDIVDLADLIMSGTSFKDAVRGTEFDALDEETAKEFEESIQRLTALRESRLEEYLEEQGSTELLDKVRAIVGKPKKSEEAGAAAPPKKKKTVEMAQGKWAEILVHTDRVTKTVKGGMEIQYRALVTVGNLNGVGGFAIGKADTPAVAITEASRKAKLLPNLVYVERYKQASLCQDLMGKHNGSKVYIWSRPPGSGMRAGKLSRDILYNMGITDGACKIIGRRNKYSMIYAMFDALAKHRGIESIARGRGKRILSLQREMAGRFA